MTSWYLAPSLVRLRSEVDQAWPDRDRRSDGAIGDTAHSTRQSEHNPDAKGCVHALDIDVDGVDPAAIVRAAVKHPATWYVIWNRRIWSRTHGWAPKAYTGTDPHTGHVHISIQLTAAAENSTHPWGMPQPTKETTMADAFDDPNSRAFNGQDRSRIQYAADRGAEIKSLTQANQGALSTLSNQVATLAVKVDTLTGKPVDVQALATALGPLLQDVDVDEDAVAQKVVDVLSQRLQPAGS